MRATLLIVLLATCALVAYAGTIRQYSTAGCTGTPDATQTININECVNGVRLTCTDTVVMYQTWSSSTCSTNPTSMASRNANVSADYCITGTNAFGTPNNAYWKLDCSSAAATGAIVSLGAIVAAFVAHRFTL